MTKETKKAKDLLTDRPFKIIYFREDDNILYQEDYPSHIPNKDDTVVLDGKQYSVTDKKYFPEKNTIPIYVEDYNTMVRQVVLDFKSPMPTPHSGSL